MKFKEAFENETLGKEILWNLDVLLAKQINLEDLLEEECQVDHVGSNSCFYNSVGELIACTDETLSNFEAK